MKRIFTASMYFLIAIAGYGQDQGVSHKQFQSVVPQSPNAASLGKFGEIPVGTYTGVPSISLPIYEINTGKLQLSVNLSYHAAGVKVEEIASWAGLGWAVSAGGQVNRQVRGLPDESAHGYLVEHSKIRVATTMTPEERETYFTQIENGEIDAEPDVFSYNAGNISGEFFFDTSGNIVTNPISKISISGLNGWVITDNSGITYHFHNPEFTTASFLTNNALSSNVSSGVSAWLLTKMVNATGTDSIKFEYDPVVTHFTTIASQTRYHFLNGSNSCHAKETTNHTSVNEVQGYRLKKILFKGGEILFNKSNDMRLDVPDDNALESIVIHSENNRFYKKYQLHQRYAVSNGAPGTYNPGSKEYYRLMLDSVSIYDNGADPIAKYKYEYNAPEQLPHRLSYDQDYWGYYNGANNGGNFAPAMVYQQIPPAFQQSFPGANRKPNAGASQKGMLTKITYPTGGHTEFEYEPNKALTPRSLADGQVMSVSLGTTISGASVFTSPVFHIPYCGPVVANEVQTSVQVILNNGNCGSEQSLDCPLISIVDSATNGITPVTASGVISLPANKSYYITADLSNVTDSSLFQNFYIMLTWNTCTPIILGNQTWYEITAGGHRIKKISHTDPVSGITRVQQYDYKKPGTSYSSGFLVSSPDYTGNIQERHKDLVQATGQYLVYDCNFLTVSSSSNYPLLGTRGGTVGYSFITETEGQNGANGKKEYSYISPFEFPDITDYAFPYPPATSYEWKRGYPLMEKVYKSQSGGYSPVSVKTYSYTGPLAFNQDGLKHGRNVFYMYSNPGYTADCYQYSIYSQGTGLFLAEKDTTIIYPTDNSSQTMTSINEYQYSMSNYAPNETKTRGGSNKTISNKVKYAADYAIPSNNTNAVCAGILNLAGHNLLNIPVENYTIRKDASGAEFVVSGSITQFHPDRPLPEKIFVLKTDAPIPLASFTPSHINASGQFVKDSHYTEEVLFNGYDANSNLKGQQKKDNIPLSYLYDYKNSLPVAQAINASQEDIAYTSFEADGKGGWTFVGTPQTDNTAPTGTKSYLFGPDNISRSISASKTHIVSFWKKGTVNLSAGTLYRTGRTVNGWTYVEYQVGGATTISLSGAGSIDELRLYPKAAQLTSYTYEPLLGITSQSDANGNISYYEYDNLGRLKFIRDTDKNIIKAMDYQYQKPVTQ
jgi:YD repeat-containing protein